MQEKDLKLKYEFLDQCQDDSNTELRKKLVEHNTSVISDYKIKNYFLAYYDENTNLVAGLSAKSSVGKFHIDSLWVSETYRGYGLGTKLLKNLEAIAVKNQALYIRLNTYSFLAPNFYIKNGYELLAKLPILADGKKKQYDYYFVKCLR